jgi:hypothetical protein
MSEYHLFSRYEEWGLLSKLTQIPLLEVALLCDILFYRAARCSVLTLDGLADNGRIPAWQRGACLRLDLRAQRQDPRSRTHLLRTLPDACRASPVRHPDLDGGELPTDQRLGT